MSKDFLKKIQQNPCGIDKLFQLDKQVKRKHLKQIVKVQNQEVTYYTSIAKKSKSVLWYQCSLILFENGGSIMLGYCRQTKGFPFVKNIDPYIKAICALDQIHTLKITQKFINIEATQKFKRLDTKYDWQLDFQTKQLRQKWFFFLVYLWYCKNNNIKYDIDLIMNQKTKYEYHAKQNQKLEQEKIIVNLQNKLKYQNDKNQIFNKPNETELQSNQLIKQLEKGNKQQNLQIQCLKKKLKDSQQSNLQLQESKIKFLQKYAKLDQEVKQIEQQLKEKNNHIAKIMQIRKKQAQQYRKQISRNKYSLPASNNQFRNQQLQIRKIQNELNSKNQELQYKAQDLKKQKSEIYLIYQAQKSDLLNEIQKLKEEINQAQKNSKSMAQRQSKFLSQKIFLEQQIQKLSKKLSQQNQKIRNSNQIDHQKNKQIKELQSKLSQIQAQYKNLQQNLKFETSQKIKFKSKAEQNELQFNEKLEKYNKIEGQFDFLRTISEQQKQELKQQLRKIKEIQKLKEAKLRINEMQKQKIQQQLTQKNIEILRLRDQNQSLKEQIHKLKNQISKQSVAIKQLKIQTEIIVQERLSKSNLLHIFQGEILEEKQYYKEFMIQQIQTYTKKKILKTKKLFILQKDIKTDFHKYADQIPQIAVIVKTEAGFYLAGYSQSPISSKAYANKGALILALNNRKSFPVYPGKRSVTYDTFFLIIGNSEIRLKNQEWKVFSNFGIANSFFNSYGCGVNQLLGQGSAVREVKIVTFQIHQIIYK